MNDSLPAGWYTDESGQRKYWTGTEWIVPTAPDPAEKEQEPANAPEAAVEPEAGDLASHPDPYEVPTNRKSRKKTAIIAGALAALLMLGGGGTWFVIDKNNKAEAERIAAEQLEAKQMADAKIREEAAAKAVEEKKKQDAAKAALDALNKEIAERKEQDDWMTSGDAGDKWSVAESGNVYYRYLNNKEYSCGWMNCFGVAVYTIKGCPNGVYIQASLMAGEGVVGYTNARIGYLAPEEVGSEILQFSDSGVDTTRIDEINCY